MTLAGRDRDETAPLTAPPDARKSGNPLVRLLFATLLVRIAVLAVFPHAISADPDGYRELAKNVVEHGVLGYVHPQPDGSEVCLASAWRPPLYPLVLVPAEFWPWGDAWPIRALHVALGVLTVYGVVLIGRFQGLGSYALAAGAWVACDPILLVQSTQVMTETLAAAVAVLALYALARLDFQERCVAGELGAERIPTRRTWDVASETYSSLQQVQRPALSLALAVGAALGLAALCRPTFLAWAGLLLVAWFVRELWTCRRFVVSVCLFVGLALTLLPWGARNEMTLGKPIIATSHGGFTMWLANNFYYYRFLKTHDWSETWDGVLPDGPVVYGVAPSQAPAKPGGAIELAYDEAYGRLAASAIASDPVGYRLATAHRLAKFWAIEPHREGHQESVKRQALRVAIGAWYALQFALAALGLIALLFRRREPGATAWFPAFLLIVAFTYAHSVYWSDLRMRGPIEPALALFAAAGLRAIVKRIRPAKTSSPSDEPIGSSPANDG